ncbi:MAG TPA: DUF3198 domain-containing protein [Thermoplasmataceae archaeon]|nr:DUF3198 domain-containing protein [Thermoplasmataceae archaeon]
MSQRVSIREYQAYVYLILMALGVALLLITSNDLIFNNSSVYNAGFTFKGVGDWEYWIFAIAVVLIILFAYLYVKVTREYKSFRRILDGNSKQTFVKNIKKLQKIARSLGPRYQEELERKMESWKVR